MAKIITIPNFRDPLPWQIKPGDVYEFICDVDTRAGNVHPKGSRLYVYSRTRVTPHNEIGESGWNWICRSKFGLSVWATLEQCVSRGVLKKIEE